jgi:hypothetical protein
MKSMAVRALFDRLAGENPAPPRAAAVAATAGVAAAVVVYRVLRSEDDLTS